MIDPAQIEETESAMTGPYCNKDDVSQIHYISNQCHIAIPTIYWMDNDWRAKAIKQLEKSYLEYY